MKLIIGTTLVVGCMIAGFLLHQGQLILLFVPSEYLIIGGMSIGTLIIANPPRVLLGILRDLVKLTRLGGKTRKQYTEMLQMIYELMQLARREGVLALEGHVNDPEQSTIISKYTSFAKDEHAVAFFCDTLKLFVAGVLEPHPMDELMERDLEVLHHEALEPSQAIQTLADALPRAGDRRRGARHHPDDAGDRSGRGDRGHEGGRRPRRYVHGGLPLLRVRGTVRFRDGKQRHV